MALDNDTVLQWAGSTENSNLINVPDSDCQILVDIQAARYLRESSLGGGIDWYRIPITGIDQWTDKSGPAAINRTAKVHAVNDVLLGRHTDIPTFGLVGGTNPDSDEKPLEDYTLDKYFDKMLINRDPEENSNAFVTARVWMYDKQIDEWKLTHHGYVGGYGPSGNSVKRKFWIYDVADLLRDIPVGKGFENTTLNTLIDFVVSGEDDTGRPVGVNNATPFTVTALNFPNRSQIATRTIGELVEEQQQKDDSEGGIFSQLVELGSDFLFQPETRVVNTKGVEKNFTRNRNNVVDVLNYIATLIDGIWYFRPKKDGVALEIRSDWSNTDFGRTFVDSRTPSADITDDRFEVQLKENDALTDIKPINTISVNGKESSQLNLGIDIEDTPFGDFIAGISSESTITEQYPYVKLRYDPFYEAAGNVELGPTDVRSDATDIDAAKRDAYREFFAHIEESTEGRIELFGDPMPLPYDFIFAIPACNGTITDTKTQIKYRINDVHHSKHNGEHFTTELGVHANVENVNVDDADDGTLDGEGTNFTVVSEIRQAQ